MKKVTKDNWKEVKEKLEYLNLDLNNIPEIFKQYKPIEFRTIHENEHNKYKIYKYVDVSDIQIYITPKNRSDAYIEKYKNARSIINYFEPKEEDDIPRQINFFNMLKKVDIDEINKIDSIQKEIDKKIPFLVRYEKNYLWEIYYSKVNDRYFMMVPEEGLNYECLFYLIKKQIESKINNKKIRIFVPICYVDYTSEYLKKSELADIESYLWLFTKNWPSVYEVFDKKESLSIQIIGKTYIYDRLKSDYRIKLKTRDDALKFYKFLRALFILQSELPNFYKFNPRINGYGELKLYFENNKIELDDLPDFLEKQYKNILKNIEESIDLEQELQKELKKKKKISDKNDITFHNKEREIAFYLECKKTFFGKIKYFFKHKKKDKNNKIKEEEKENIVDIKKEEINIEEKKYYTIEDVINITKKFENIDTKVKNINMDIKALDIKIKTMEVKIKNADIYINEIENHKKSIFDFWKFTNKDENLVLNEGKKNNESNVELQRTFDYDTGFEEFAEKIDTIQRKEFSKKECDSIYLVQTNLLECLNIIKPYVDKDKEISPKDNAILKIKLDLIQKEAEKKKDLFNEEEFDIFGSLSEDNTKIKYINGKKHREIEKNKFDILKINKNTNINEFIDRLKESAKNIINSDKNSYAINNMSIYKCSKEKLKAEEFSVFELDIQNCITNKEKENLYKINIKEKMNIIYLSNIIYFDNNNNTLPLGMDMSDKALLDMKNYELKLVNKDDIKINIKNGINNNVKSIEIFEYDLIKK